MESEQESIIERLTTERAQMQATAEAAEYYNIQLQLSQERFEKLPALERVDAWMASQNELFAAANYGSSLGEVASLLASFETYTTNVEPQKQVLDTMESNQDEINGPLEELRGKMAATEEAAEAYHTQLLLSQERLDKLPQLERVDAWAAQQNALFAAGEYGATVAAVQELQSAFETFTVNLAARQKVLDGMESYQEEILSKLQASKDGLAETSAAGDAYSAQLVMSLERHEKLPQLDRVAAWLGKQRQLFDAADYGDTLTATANLLSSFESFGVNFAAQKQIATDMSSEQQVILDRVAEVVATADETEAAGAEYHRQLQLSQERHEMFAALQRVEEWLNAENEVFAAGDYGDNLVAVATKLSTYETFQVNLAAKQQVCLLCWWCCLLHCGVLMRVAWLLCRHRHWRR